MPNVISRGFGTRLPSSAAPADIDIVSERVGEAPAVQVSHVDDLPIKRSRSALLAIDNRMRRSIAARAAAADVPSEVAALASGKAAPPNGGSDALERQEIDSALREWVDYDKAARYDDSPSLLLQAVAAFDHRPIPPEFEMQLDPSLLEDEQILDTAAVLYDQLREGSSSPTRGADMPLAERRRKFLVALREDYALRRALDALGAQSGEARQKTPFFDGFAIRNAKHKTFDELAALPEVSADPAFAALTMEKKRSLLEKKFAQMGESTLYAIGTPEHSLATALLRVQRYRGMPVPMQFDNRASLLEAFKQVEKDWTTQRFYPYHPRLLFAAHLARSDGYEVMSPDDLLLVYENRVASRALGELASGNDLPAKWVAQYLSQLEVKGLSWKAQGELARTQVIQSLFAALSEAADGSEPIAGFARELRDSGALSAKRFIGKDEKARLDALITYGNERLLAVFGAPPRFDRREAAVEVLRNHGLSQTEIDETRNYVIAGDNPHISRTNYGDLVDEFLERADWSGLVGSRMTLASGLQIVPRDELQQGEERFNNGLRSNLWVAARAQENLWTKDVQPTAQAQIEEVARIAGDLKTETESHRAWVRGAETWINTVPVAGPLYNIEEGIRHHDAARAAFGLLFLGVDLFDLGTAGGGRVRGGEVGRFHPVVAKMRHTVAHLDASMGDVASHPLMVKATVDPVDIAVRDGDIPLVRRDIAQRVRNGDRHVRWRDYDVVHLEHENRIVPVAQGDGQYYEIDWRSGRRVRVKSPLERNPLTGKLQPRHGTPDGIDADAPTIRGSEVEKRFTVDKVKGILKDAQRADLRDFDKIFGENFEYKSANGASTFDAEEFFGRLYKSSRTFRRLVNRFEDVESRVRNSTRDAFKKWELQVGEAGPLGSPRKAYTDFEHRRIYMPEADTIEAMEYMTAAGPRPMSPEQAYLHEMVHALTGARDPERMLDMLNRGPVVYLTDKILSEGGYAMAEQVMYRRENSLPDMPPQETVEYHRPSATDAAHAENRYLDPWVDARPTAVPEETLIEGVPIGSRITVRESKEIMHAVAMGDDDVFLSMDDFDTKFKKNFGFYARNGTTEVVASDATVVTNFYRRLYRKSETFRYLFDCMPAVDAGADATWRFMLDEEAPVGAVAQGASLHPASPSNKEIYLLDDGLRYLSSSGMRDVEFERKLTYDMVCAMGGFRKLAPAETYRNRGTAVYLTDRILQEAGFHYPKQLAAALASVGDRAAEDRLLAYQTSAQRSAAVEDRYMLQD
jgi:PipA protein